MPIQGGVSLILLANCLCIVFVFVSGQSLSLIFRLSSSGVHLQGVHLHGVHLQGVHLQSICLQGVYVQGVHLQSVHLQAAYLQGVIFRAFIFSRSSLSLSAFLCSNARSPCASLHRSARVLLYSFEIEAFTKSYKPV